MTADDATVDREQIRAYAQTIAEDRPRPRYPETWKADKSEARTLASHCLTLLDELEQAEKEREGLRTNVADLQRHLEHARQGWDKAEDRLATVPALVDALLALTADPGVPEGTWKDAGRAALKTWGEA